MDKGQNSHKETSSCAELVSVSAFCICISVCVCCVCILYELTVHRLLLSMTIFTIYLCIAVVLINLAAAVSSPFATCKEVTEQRQYPTRRLYIFCFEGKTGIKFHRYIDVWKWTTYNLRHDRKVVVEVVQAPWDSRSLDKFLTKPKNYLDHVNAAIDTEKRSGRPVEDAYVMIIDSDTLFSNPVIDDIWQRYECARNGKDLVVATETNCWLGRYCFSHDIKKWYPETPPAYSVFVNSGAVMGTLHAMRDMLINITTSSAMYFIEAHNGKLKYDDQYAVAAYAMERPKTVALDIQQALFGTYNIFNPTAVGSSLPFVCRKSDSINSEYNYHCSDITPMAARDGVIYMDDNCAIRRMANRTQNRILFSIADSLAPDPIMWHGNGSGKRMYMNHRVKVFNCLLNYYNVNISHYKCDDEGCGERKDTDTHFAMGFT